MCTPVGPVDSRFEALWSTEESYVAINKQRSFRPGGDEMWIVALPSGKVVRKQMVPCGATSRKRLGYTYTKSISLRLRQGISDPPSYQVGKGPFVV